MQQTMLNECPVSIASQGPYMQKVDDAHKAYNSKACKRQHQVLAAQQTGNKNCAGKGGKLSLPTVPFEVFLSTTEMLHTGLTKQQQWPEKQPCAQLEGPLIASLADGACN